jgi:hypothetical protein
MKQERELQNRRLSNSARLLAIQENNPLLTSTSSGKKVAIETLSKKGL